MSVFEVNPESVVLRQLDAQWQKIAMLILWKLAGTKKVRVSAKDIEAMANAFEPGIPMLYTHGHSDSFEFQIVDERAAARIAEYDKTQRGTA